MFLCKHKILSTHQESISQPSCPLAPFMSPWQQSLFCIMTKLMHAALS